MKDVFKIESEHLTKLNQIPFENEKILQILIEKNLDTVFDGLEFLSTEFQIKDLRPDSVAFDTEKEFLCNNRVQKCQEQASARPRCNVLQIIERV